MRAKIDLKGQKFGRLVVLEEDTVRTRTGSLKWVCSCTCGTIKSVIASDLKTGNTRSCGCLKKESYTKHGLSKHPLYVVWVGMRGRCYDPKSPSYYNYGGRGVKVCDYWLEDFMNFYNDMSPTYKDDLQLDRINNDGNYLKENCRWVTVAQNLHNKRGCHNTTSIYKGVSKKKGDKKWKAKICKNGKDMYLGNFSCEKEAALAYNKKAIELNGKYAYLNKIEE